MGEEELDEEMMAALREPSDILNLDIAGGGGGMPAGWRAMRRGDGVDSVRSAGRAGRGCLVGIAPFLGLLAGQRLPGWQRAAAPYEQLADLVGRPASPGLLWKRCVGVDRPNLPSLGLPFRE